VKPSEASIMKMPLRAFAPSLSRTTMQAGMPVPQKRLSGQTKDAPYVAALDEALTNGAFGIPAK
jgi:hypothetical protein